MNEHRDFFEEDEPVEKIFGQFRHGIPFRTVASKDCTCTKLPESAFDFECPVHGHPGLTEALSRASYGLPPEQAPCLCVPLPGTPDGHEDHICGRVRCWPCLNELIALNDRVIAEHRMRQRAKKINALWWHVQPNDLVGGWCIMTVPLPPSRGEGDQVGDFLTKDTAQLIVDLHNDWLVNGCPPSLEELARNDENACARADDQPQDDQDDAPQDVAADEGDNATDDQNDREKPE